MRRRKTIGRKGERNIWRRRFREHMIRNAEDLDARVAHVRWNPVKHGYVKGPDDWPHSTWREWKKEFGRPINVPPKDWRPSHLGET